MTTMKRKVFLPLMLFVWLPTLLTGQESYHPLVTDGKTWKGAEVGVFWQEYKYDYFLKGDTTINGVGYLKCFLVSERGVSGTPAPGYVGAMREESKKVYAVRKGSQQECLLFDFGLHVGDSVLCKEGGLCRACLSDTNVGEWIEGMEWVMTLESIDTHAYEGGLPLRRYHFNIKSRYRFADGSVSESEPRDIGTCWTEGIGNVGDYPFNSAYVEMTSSYHYVLFGCYDNDDVLYQVSPANVLENPTPVSRNKAGMYDLNGRTLPQRPAKGIYIQNGQKRLSK